MGLPMMIGLLAFVAFAPKLSGLGILIGLIAFGLVQLIIGAAMRLGGPPRPAPEEPPPGELPGGLPG
jgi:hypothetical protein